MGNCIHPEINTLRDEISLLRNEQKNSINLVRNEIYNMNAFFKPYSCDSISEEPPGPPPILTHKCIVANDTF